MKTWNEVIRSDLKEMTYINIEMVGSPSKDLAWNIVVISGLQLLAATWKC